MKTALVFDAEPTAQSTETGNRFLPKRSRRRVPAALAVILAASALGLASSRAQDATISPGEVWTAPARAARKQNPIPADPKSIAQGKELFTAACLPCHGPAGKGDGPVAATLERNGVPVRPGNLSDPKIWEQSDGAIFWKISEGRSPMPSFQEAYTEEQRWLIVDYVRTLAPPPIKRDQTTKQEK
jgi:mono/diheme cytochrome c family protein